MSTSTCTYWWIWVKQPNLVMIILWSLYLKKKSRLSFFLSNLLAAQQKLSNPYQLLFYEVKWFPFSCVIISCALHFSFPPPSLHEVWRRVFPQEKKKVSFQAAQTENTHRERERETAWKDGSLKQRCDSSERRVGSLFHTFRPRVGDTHTYADLM